MLSLVYFNATEDSCVPSTPGCPRIVKVIGREVSLMWAQPDNDGGSEITGYLIAYAYGFCDMPHHVTVGVTTTAKVEEMFTRGRSYVFAVAAKNAFGCGDFSPLSAAVKIPNYNGNFVLHSYVMDTVFDMYGDLTFHRTMLCIVWTMLLQVVCLSVHLSVHHTPVLCRRG